MGLSLCRSHIYRSAHKSGTMLWNFFISLTDRIGHLKKSDKIEILDCCRIPGYFLFLFVDYLYFITINIIPILQRKTKLGKIELLTKFFAILYWNGIFKGYFCSATQLISQDGLFSIVYQTRCCLLLVVTRNMTRDINIYRY